MIKQLEAFRLDDFVWGDPFGCCMYPVLIRETWKKKAFWHTEVGRFGLRRKRAKAAA